MNKFKKGDRVRYIHTMVAASSFIDKVGTVTRYYNDRVTVRFDDRLVRNGYNGYNLVGDKFTFKSGRFVGISGFMDKRIMKHKFIK